MTQAVPPPAPKKGLSGLVIAGIGCCGLFVVVVVLAVFIAVHEGGKYVAEFKKNPSKAGALLVIKTNPDLHVLRTDDAAGTVTMRDDETGKEVTVPFADINSGKYSVVNSKGQGMRITHFDSHAGQARVSGPDGVWVAGGGSGAAPPPIWVPVYPGAKSTAGMRSEKKDGMSGTVSLETAASVAQVQGFYEHALRDQKGYETQATAARENGADSVVLTATNDHDHRKITMIVNHENGKTTVLLTYEEAKPDGP